MKSIKSKAPWLYICLLPLLYSLFLACYQAFDGSSITGYSVPFARINSYIYAHSYGALLIMLFVGIKIGSLLSNKQATSMIGFYLVVAMVTWASFKSFADMQGIALMMLCFLITWLYEIKFENKTSTTKHFDHFNKTIKPIVTVLLLLHLLING